MLFQDYIHEYLSHQADVYLSRMSRLFAFSPSIMSGCKLKGIVSSFLPLNTEGAKEVLRAGKIFEDEAVKRFIKYLIDGDPSIGVNDMPSHMGNLSFADWLFERRVLREIVIREETDDYIISGRIDALVITDGPFNNKTHLLDYIMEVESNNTVHLLEIKTKSRDRINNMETPEQHHVMQAGFYLWKLKQYYPHINAQGHLVYFARDDINTIKIFSVPEYPIDESVFRLYTNTAKLIADIPIKIDNQWYPAIQVRNALHALDFYLKHIQYRPHTNSIVQQMINSFPYIVEIYKNAQIDFNNEADLLWRYGTILQKQLSMQIMKYLNTNHSDLLDLLMEPGNLCKHYCPVEGCQYKLGQENTYSASVSNLLGKYKHKLKKTK